MQLPIPLLESLKDLNGFDKKAFEQVHDSGEQVTSIRINPRKSPGKTPRFFQGEDPVTVSPIPWTGLGYYLGNRPSFTFDPLFHAGTYYVQEASSMFLEQAIRQTTDLSKPLRILDLCAAPGGKSTHIQSIISADSLLLSNEVIRTRVNVLRDNIIKWGTGNVVVTQNDPKDFSRLENYFDILVVDAPCSGSGLFRRDPEAIGEWSQDNVALCSQRQQRILADCWPALKDEGLLIYSTCSYSQEEDEGICEWLEKEFSLHPVTLSVKDDWGVVRSGGGYRFWPDKLKGEGFFIACFRKIGAHTPIKKIIKASPNRLDKKEMTTVEKWIDTTGKDFIKHGETVYAWPSALTEEISFLLEKLRVVYSGILAGELVRDKLIPAHSLAMCTGHIPDIERIPLDHSTAIRYLQKKELDIILPSKGWKLVTYMDHPLGWINALQNRINNYYPKEMRILKDN